MNVEGLSGLVNRVTAWADGLQRRHGVLGFPYAVVKKHGDDEADGRRPAFAGAVIAGVAAGISGTARHRPRVVTASQAGGSTRNDSAVASYPLLSR